MKSKAKINDAHFSLFTEIKGGLKGYWSDSIRIDRIVIEANYCPKCHRSLEYVAFANADFYRSFGICEKCRFAREFWLDSAMFAAYKKRICEAAANSA